LNVPFIADLQ